jgi:hypothetical protein
VNAPSDSRRELDAMVVEIELTLTSIVQGVALYFLIDNARTVLSIQQSAFWLYVVGGLLISLGTISFTSHVRWASRFSSRG